MHSIFVAELAQKLFSYHYSWRAMHTRPSPSTALLRFLRRQAGLSSRRPIYDSSKIGDICSLRCDNARLRVQYSQLHHSTNSLSGSAVLSNSNRASRLPSQIPSTQHCSRGWNRLFSSSSRASGIWNHLWGIKKRQAEAYMASRGLPPLASFLDDNTTPGRALKGPNELRLRCTEFDDKGDVTLVSGEFKKSELIAKVN